MNTKTPFFVLCPHCDSYVEILEINCAIFRHGVFKDSGEQIPPHSSEEQCRDYIEKNSIYGCGKPFRLLKRENEYITEQCGYI